MSCVTTINFRKPEEITLGTMTVYCDRLKAAEIRNFTEETTVSGSDVVTNSAPRALRLTLSLRIADDDQPMRCIKEFSDILRSGTDINFTYRGLEFRNCHVQSFNAEDSGSDFVTASLTLMTLTAVDFEEVEE